jgi:hypothetical protein
LTMRLNDCSEVVLEPIRHLEMAPEPEKCLAIVRSKEESNDLTNVLSGGGSPCAPQLRRSLPPLWPSGPSGPSDQRVPCIWKSSS